MPIIGGLGDVYEVYMMKDYKTRSKKKTSSRYNIYLIGPDGKFTGSSHANRAAAYAARKDALSKGYKDAALPSLATKDVVMERPGVYRLSSDTSPHAIYCMDITDQEEGLVSKLATTPTKSAPTGGSAWQKFIDWLGSIGK